MSETKTWTVNALCNLTGIDRRTIKKRLLGVPADDSGGYDARRALPALYGHSAGGKLPPLIESSTRLEAAKAEREELRLARDKGKLVETEAIYKHFEGVFVAFRQKILASGLTEEEKDEILNDLRRLTVRDIQ